MLYLLSLLEVLSTLIEEGLCVRLIVGHFRIGRLLHKGCVVRYPDWKQAIPFSSPAHNGSAVINHKQ